MLAGDTINSFLRAGFSSDIGLEETQLLPTGWMIKMAIGFSLSAKLLKKKFREFLPDLRVFIQSLLKEECRVKLSPV